MAVSENAAEQFEELFRELLPQIRGYARRHGGADVVDDVASETFIVVWRRWADIPADADGRRAWVFGIARHKLAHALEDATRRRTRVERWARLVTPHSADAVSEIVDRDRITRLLDTLPPKEREAFALTVWEGLSARQAAAALGCSVTALTTRLMRARRKLERELAADSPATPGEVVDSAR